MNSSENRKFPGHEGRPGATVTSGSLSKSTDSTFLSLLEVLLNSTADHRVVRTPGDACGFLSSTGTLPESFWAHVMICEEPSGKELPSVCSYWRAIPRAHGLH